jgi:Predicted membrane protein (DUF2127)
MSNPDAEPKILQRPLQVRYLKLIAIFKILTGIVFLVLGFSLLFLNSRSAWMDAISDWTDDEILLAHSRFVHLLLNGLQGVLVGGRLQATGLLALIYCGVLLTEGIGVYRQKRWGELLMIFATAILIPAEIWHIGHRPSIAAGLVLIANCFIVWFLYRVLKREARHNSAPVEPEVAEIS